MLVTCIAVLAARLPLHLNLAKETVHGTPPPYILPS